MQRLNIWLHEGFFFFYLGFLSRTFTNHRTAGEEGGNFFNSSLPLPPASQALRHQPGDYCRELTSAHSQQPDSNREPLASKRKSVTTKLRALYYQTGTCSLQTSADNLQEKVFNEVLIRVVQGFFSNPLVCVYLEVELEVKL